MSHFSPFVGLAVEHAGARHRRHDVRPGLAPALVSEAGDKRAAGAIRRLSPLHLCRVRRKPAELRVVLQRSLGDTIPISIIALLTAAPRAYCPWVLA